jgi:hypothetical protein
MKSIITKSMFNKGIWIGWQGDDLRFMCSDHSVSIWFDEESIKELISQLQETLAENTLTNKES